MIRESIKISAKESIDYFEIEEAYAMVQQRMLKNIRSKEIS
jgi:hypothetical protein